MTNVLCETCTTVIQNSEILQTRPGEVWEHGHVECHPHLNSIAELRTSASNGCHLCSLALGSSLGWDDANNAHNNTTTQGDASDQGYSQNPDALSVYVRASSKASPNAFLLDDVKKGGFDKILGDTYKKLWKNGFPETSPCNEINFWPLWRSLRVVLNHQVLIPDLAPNPILGPSTGSEDALELASWWYQRCCRTHQRCAQDGLQAGQDMPARLLYVGHANDPDSLRVCPYSAKEGNQPYATLSHCWGQLEILKLTEATLGTLQNEIDLRDLTKTFQDAVTVTRKLQIRYIWMDSLCIIQDSKIDWQRESVKMGSIYANSTLTIAALKARDGSEGLFSTRNPLSFQACVLPPGEVKVLNEPHWDEECDDMGKSAAPLHKRAWVVQERLSSPRTLYFGSTGIFWECILQKCTESCPNEDIITYKSNPKPELRSLLRPTRTREERYAFQLAWTKIIEMYTGCLLTHCQDKPIAIEGIANLIGSTIGLTFLSGLWKDFIFLEMLWEVDGPTFSTRLPLGFPSWSWISMSSKIHTVYLRLSGQDPRFENWVEWENKRLSGNTPIWAADLLDVHPGTAPDRITHYRGTPTVLRLRAELKKVKLATSAFAFPARKASKYPEPLWRYRLRFVDDPEARGYSWRPDEAYEPPQSGTQFFMDRTGDAWTLPLVKWRISPAGLRVAGIVVVPADGGRWRRIGRYDYRLGSVPNADFQVWEAHYEHFYPWEVGERVMEVVDLI